jgi:regulator of sigma E protease
MQYFFAIVFVFGILVLIHELGHFLAAKWMGVRVEKFSIGFPPRIFSKKIGETEFSISAIPLGGYVKMAGFIDESMDSNLTGAPYEYNSKPIWRRIIIISAGVIMNFILAVIIFTSLNYFIGEKVIRTTTIEALGSTGVAQKIGFKPYDRITHVNGEPVSDWKNLGKKIIDNLNSDIEFMVIRDHAIVNLIYRKDLFQEKGGEQIDIIPLIPAKIGTITPDSPAERLGLVTGDEIISVDGKKVDGWYKMAEVIHSSPDKEISIQWKRDDIILSGMVIPEAVEARDENGSAITYGIIGIAQYRDRVKAGLVQSLKNGFNSTVGNVYLTMRGLWWMFTGAKSAQESVGGPITIGRMIMQAVEIGWEEVWELTATLSAIIAFFNILPIPALDGGHLLFLMIEGIKKKPLSSKVKIKIQKFGMAVLLTLIALVIYLDIIRL